MTVPTDTIVYDSLAVARWQALPKYDYNRELVMPRFDLLEWLGYWVNRLLQRTFGSSFAEKYTDTVLITLFVVAVLLVVWMLYKRRPELFVRSRKTVPYRVEEDTIYGVDFGKELDAAVACNNYREAVRLLYLQTLKHLSDTEQIVWEPFKTPTEYLYEVKNDSRKRSFRELTNRFLRVRYGNFEATAGLYREMRAFQQEVMKGGAA